MLKKALFYKNTKKSKDFLCHKNSHFSGLKNKIVQCQLCPQFCILKIGEIGKCRARKNNNGELYSLTYGKPVSINIDPIEKKPIYHFLPRTFSFSIGMAGCNLACGWCQNWSLSQKDAEEFDADYIRPEELIKNVLKSGCPSVSYTYSEPLVSYEYVMDSAKLARKKGLKNILVTNGFVNKEPFEKIAKYIDAMNIDLKSFNEKTYSKFCNAKLAPVLETIKSAYKKGIHIEITTLIIPGINDSSDELEKIAKFISSVDESIPWHISRFFPCYKMENKEITPKSTLENAYKIGKKYLKNVYLGNI
ncbi:MAG: AmmeMemoRadiSam system radical SAM enzyme [Candidatus Nanoarchaeia archaeon]|nr:AmmeMemoRadiSam system radical SAM enzyme [Candidatus Nanoarchaeia archaeon]